MMFKKLALTAAVVLSLGGTSALAAGSAAELHDVDFSFEGPFGKFDQNQLQRGLKVFTEVCAACHGLKYVSFRSLAEDGGPGFTEAQVRAYAANYDVYDAELEDTRPAKPADHFPANTGAGAPDLSLMAKARAGFHGPANLGFNQLVKGMGGPEYIVGILTGYTGKEKTEAGVTLYENTAFPGGWISMAPPLLEDGLVTFDDGHDNSIHHMAEDTAAFLMWAAEPKLMARKHVGFLGVFMLVILSVLLYLTNKKIWAPHKRKHA